ncbi:DUF2207 family protein [Tessaracoccus caeni]|uniref:DUF2207 family protein n=1 Tax=Tessaracoccus caeni TaxID=3031239 RepID=UPI0023DA31BE|nr:DUF2207 domain-containing protein [Tessaracoccus caeni]MDF1489312.1 DUF2207 domain-containing protein [Tessaracoccus caeni]
MTVAPSSRCLRIARRLGAGAVLATLLAVGVVLPARADGGTAESFEFEGWLSSDGVLKVTETVTFAEGQAPEELTQAIPVAQELNRHDSRLFEVDEVTVRVDGALVEPETATGSEDMTLTIPTDGAHEVEVSYRVLGATRTVEGEGHMLTMAEWPVVRGLSVAVTSAKGVLNAEAPVQLIDCRAGQPGSVAKCDAYAAGMFDSPQPTFSHASLAAGDEVWLTTAFPPDAVAATERVHVRWSLDRAFGFSANQILIALGVALLGAAGLYLLHRRGGTDLAPGETTAIGGFQPIGHGESVFVVAEGLRPGLVGTVADERVDPVDVTATLLDLAVRGHLLITELPHELHGLLDWRLTRTENPPAGDELLPFERDLLASVGDGVLASQLPAQLAPALAQVQDDLYDEVVARGWFESRPDSTRNSWRTRGYAALGAAVVAAVLLIALTGFGLLALVLVALALGLIWVSDRMPRRTIAGSEVLVSLQALSVLLATHPTDHAPAGRELQELSKLLPYAVVLGGKDRWIQAMADADRDDDPDPTAISWYHAPDTWHLRDLPASLTQFIHTIQGELFGR